MNIVIDGYNLLKQAVGKEVGERERDRFHALAVDYARFKKHTLFIVYDGGSMPRPEITKKGPVTTVFSGYKHSADDIIKSYIDEGSLKDMLLVTTDRQLNGYASRAGVPSIDSLDFYKLMKEAQTQPLKPRRASVVVHKLHEGEGSAEIDVLMQEAASVPYHKKEEETERKGRRTSSKQEKRMKALLRKL